jgi:hypothetical protein
MSVLSFQPRGRWAWDARGYQRAVRVSPHPAENVVNLSVWRDDVCVGTVRLLPDEVSALVAGLTDGLVELARRPTRPVAAVADVTDRGPRPSWRDTVARVRTALASIPGPSRTARPWPPLAP